jgi:hypothetical protein
MQPMPGGYVCEQGISYIIVPDNQVAAVLAMAATDYDRQGLEMAKRRYAEELRKAAEKGQSESTVGFSVQSLFREVTGHDYPALESAVVLDVPALPPEQLLSEERAQSAQARMLANVVREAMFAEPDAKA